MAKKKIVPPCSACAFSGIEPMDMDLTCGHPSSGPMGLHVMTVNRTKACGKEGKFFKQHPYRTKEGYLK